MSKPRIYLLFCKNPPLFGIIFTMLLWYFVEIAYMWYSKTISQELVENPTIVIDTEINTQKTDSHIISDNAKNLNKKITPEKKDEDSFLEEIVLNAISTMLYSIQEKVLEAFISLSCTTKETKLSVPDITMEFPQEDITIELARETTTIKKTVFLNDTTVPIQQDNTTVPIQQNHTIKDKHTIYGPAIEGPQRYSEEETCNILESLTNNVKELLSFETIEDNRFFKTGFIVSNLLDKNALLQNLFSNDVNEVRNVNYIINILSQNAMMKFITTKDIIYCHIALGLMIKQMAVLENLDPLYFLEDPTIYMNMKKHFMTRFRV